MDGFASLWFWIGWSELPEPAEPYKTRDLLDAFMLEHGLSRQEQQAAIEYLKGYHLSVGSGPRRAIA